MVEDRYDYVQILGRVRIDDNQEVAQAQMARMAAKYLSDPALLAKNLAMFKTQHRILIEIVPERIGAHGKPIGEE
jgi:hypothetical protein